MTAFSASLNLMRFVALGLIAALAVAGCVTSPKIVTTALVVDGRSDTYLLGGEPISEEEAVDYLDTHRDSDLPVVVVYGREVTVLTCKAYCEFIDMFFSALLSRASLVEEPNPVSHSTDGD
jgi:hypothetical protein